MATRSLNKVMIIGNLTRDTELRYTANNTPLVTFGVATNREYKPAEGTERVEETEFHNVVAWSKLAELCDQLLSKGQKVFIEGRLRTRNWVDEQSGKKMYRTEIVAEEMIVLSPGRNRAQRSEQAQVNQPTQANEGKETDQADVKTQQESKEKEIPF